jgi:hypothetical protein
MAFLFRLQTADGAPAEPPRLESAVPNWRAGDRFQVTVLERHPAYPSHERRFLQQWHGRPGNRPLGRW